MNLKDECNLRFLKNTLVQIISKLNKRSFYDYFLINYYTTKLQSKFLFGSDTGALTAPKRVNKFYAAKTKDLVSSYQTLLFCNQSKAKLLLIKCTELTISAQN